MEYKKVFKAAPHFKSQLFQFAQTFDHIAWLDSHSASSLNDGVELLVAIGSVSTTVHSASSFDNLKSFLKVPKWAFGFLSYDLKNEIEPQLNSSNVDQLQFPALYFFEPAIVISIKNKEVQISSHDNELVDQVVELNKEQLSSVVALNNWNVSIQARTPEEIYVQKVKEILKHISRGDIYEMNYCHEFYAEQAMVNPFQLYEQLVTYSPTPFASLIRVKDHYILCASPERFIKKEGDRLISQPIKGTIRRGEDEKEDKELANKLRRNPKERSENIMIVDLVRNDLSQVAKDGSVQVDELCQIYSFPQVHQMISTVSCRVNPELDATSILKKCFPMGSMTGAPKLKAMELIEKFEDAKRGVYSGSIGYFTPEGDFDFNVVIRTLLYNAENNYLSFSVGGAITINSDPVEEYQETLLKAKAIIKVLAMGNS